MTTTFGRMARLPRTRLKFAADRNRRLIQEAREAERLRTAVMHAALDAIVISGDDGRIIEINPTAERLFGGPADNFVGRFMSDLVVAPGPQRAVGIGNMLGILGQRVALDAMRQDGSVFPAEIAVQRVCLGRRTRFAAYIRDLTPERRATVAAEAQQQHLLQIEKLSAMGALLAGVAHELNNPLAILVAQATLLRDKAPNPDIEKRAERIHAAAQRAARIVKGFMALATHKPATRAVITLRAVFDEALELLGYSLRSAGIVVSMQIAPDLPEVEADHDLLVQVLANVLINAQEALLHRSGDRRIVIRSDLEPTRIILEIEDNGPGVAAAVAERLFEPYVTTKPVGGGLGIGLSLCRSVLDQHGGTIDYRSTASGTLFRIALPRPVVQSEVLKVEMPPRASGGLRILVVDDEIDVARSLAELIEIFGHSVAVETSATDALDRLGTGSFDAVFTDFRMPGLDGVALRRRIAAFDPALATRTILVTGDTVQRAQGHAHPTAEPGALLLEKPFTAADIKALLARLAAP